MDQRSTDALAKTVLFANGLRKNIAGTGRRWTTWPGGTHHLATVIACIDRIQQRLQTPPTGDETAGAIAACVADLRAVLEWASYQSASLATARAIVFARKTRTFVKRFGLLNERDADVSTLANSESSLIDDVRAKNGYMTALAERHAHIGLPRPLVNAESLVPAPARTAGKLDLIRRLTKSAKADVAPKRR